MDGHFSFPSPGTAFPSPGTAFPSPAKNVFSEKNFPKKIFFSFFSMQPTSRRGPPCCSKEPFWGPLSFPRMHSDAGPLRFKREFFFAAPRLGYIIYIVNGGRALWARRDGDRAQGCCNFFQHCRGRGGCRLLYILYGPCATQIFRRVNILGNLL